MNTSDWEAFKTAEGSMHSLCEFVAGGESLAAFARRMGFPYTTLLGWIDGDEIRAENYARAREARADLIFDQLDDVSEQAVTAESAVEVAGLRLKSDNIKWKLARMAPKRYGDKVETVVSGSLDHNLSVNFVGS